MGDLHLERIQLLDPHDLPLKEDLLFLRDRIDCFLLARRDILDPRNSIIFSSRKLCKTTIQNDLEIYSSLTHLKNTVFRDQRLPFLLNALNASIWIEEAVSAVLHPTLSI